MTLTLSLAAVAAFAVWFAISQSKRAARFRDDLTAAKRRNTMLLDRVKEDKKIIEAMGNARKKAQKAHEHIRTGSDRERFDASLSELQDTSGSE